MVAISIHYGAGGAVELGKKTKVESRVNLAFNFLGRDILIFFLPKSGLLGE